MLLLAKMKEPWLPGWPSPGEDKTTKKTKQNKTNPTNNTKPNSVCSRCWDDVYPETLSLLLTLFSILTTFHEQNRWGTIRKWHIFSHSCFCVPRWTLLHLPPSIKTSGSPTPDLLTLRENGISIHCTPQGNLISVIRMSGPLQELKCLASLQVKFPPFLLAQEAPTQ